ncbi:hypothetical protein BF14_004090 [Streptomyces griseus]|nr:hypothetical protein BF14_004090 [Streptomyces griseus]
MAGGCEGLTCSCGRRVDGSWQDRVGLADLADETWLLPPYDAGCDDYGALADACAPAGFAPLRGPPPPPPRSCPGHVRGPLRHPGLNRPAPACRSGPGASCGVQGCRGHRSGGSSEYEWR